MDSEARGARRPDGPPRARDSRKRILTSASRPVRGDPGRALSDPRGPNLPSPRQLSRAPSGDRADQGAATGLREQDPVNLPGEGETPPTAPGKKGTRQTAPRPVGRRGDPPEGWAGGRDRGGRGAPRGEAPDSDALREPHPTATARGEPHAAGRARREGAVTTHSPQRRGARLPPSQNDTPAPASRRRCVSPTAAAGTERPQD